MNDNIKEDTILKSGSKYAKMPIEYHPPKYSSSNILIIIFTFILFSIFSSVVFYMIFLNKNKGFQKINLYPNGDKNDNQSNECDIGKGEKCFSCNKKECGSCNHGYKLDKGNCIPNYTLKAIYQTSIKNEIIPLINEDYTAYINELIIDNQKIANPTSKYFFIENGEHIVIITFKKEELITMKMMFNNIPNLMSITFEKEFSNYNIINMKGLFSNCQNLKNVEFLSPIPSKVKDFSFMFDNCKSITDIKLNNIITKNAIDISYMFSKCSSLKSIDLKTLDTTKVIEMSGLFYECTSLTQIDLSKLNTKKVESMIYMFAGCTSLQNINLNSFETKKLKDMSYMFKDCSKLTNVDLSHFNTHNITNINGLFLGCSSLTSVNMNKFNVVNIKYANKVFDKCNKMNQNIIKPFSKADNESNSSEKKSSNNTKKEDNIGKKISEKNNTII